MCQQEKGKEDYFYGNKAVLTGTNVGGFTCSGDGATVVHDNAYYTSTGNISECKMDLTAWQAQGGDKGSTVGMYPKDDEIIGWAKEMLGF